MKSLKDIINEARTPSLTSRMKKDIDSYINGMDKSDLKRLRDNWKEDNDVYNNMMFNMDMYLFAGIPGKFDPYKQLTSDYIYSKILDKIGVN